MAQLRAGLLRIDLAQQIVAAMTENQQLRLFVVQQRVEALRAIDAEFAGHAGIDDAPSGQLGEHRRIAFGRVGAGAEGEAVAEGEDHRIGRQSREMGNRFGARADKRDQAEQQCACVGGRCGHGHEVIVAWVERSETRDVRH